MGKIRVLPDILINKIAAGEIVERPASVVKELLENCLDAGSRRVDVEIEAGGKKRLLIRDDGEGMTRDDALLAFEHHATSKLREADELEHIATLGFRGEALPSIASISRMCLRTVSAEEVRRGDASGTQVVIHGGVMKEVREIRWAAGTEIEVSDLFFNTPARRKFLKTDATEAAHVARLVTHYALARPTLHFTLQSGGRLVVDAPPVQTLEERVHQVFGDQFRQGMQPVEANDGTVRLTGLLSHPHQKRASTDAQYFFVNGRMVRDKVLTMSLSQVYRGLIPPGTYPAAVLFVEIAPGEIDVNVHPAKTEIRFRQQWQVQNFLRAAMEGALRGGRPFARLSVPGRDMEEPSQVPPFGSGAQDPAGGMSGDGGATAPRVFQVEEEGADPGASLPRGSAGLRERVERAVGRFEVESAEKVRQESFDFRNFAPPVRSGPLPGALPDSSLRRENSGPGVSPADSGTGAGGAFPRTGPVEGAAAEAPAGSSPWRVLGQWRDSYIVAASRDELVIVDQHVAHERVLFETFLRQAEDGPVPSQPLLIPVIMELEPDQALVLEQLAGPLAESGFEVEPYGPRTIAVKAVPALASVNEAEMLLREVLSRLEGTAGAFSLADVRHRVAAGLACKAAVKVNTPLGREQMEVLLERLMETGDPTTCPHGRPVVLTLGIRDLEKNFKRI